MSAKTRCPAPPKRAPKPQADTIEVRIEHDELLGARKRHVVVGPDGVERPKRGGR